MGHMMGEGDYSLGIDLGGTKILAGVLDRKNRLIAAVKKKTRAEEGPEKVLDRIGKTALEALAAVGAQPGELGAIGICVPGPIRPEEGVIVEAPNLGWRNIQIVKSLQAVLPSPAWLSNDVTAGTWGEYCLGAGRGARHCLGVFGGTGIGGGLIFDGRLYEGASCIAGEIGHMCLDPHGVLCRCGRNGCLEAFASRTAIEQAIWASVCRGRSTMLIDEDGLVPPEAIRSKLIKKAYESGDPVVVEAVDNAAGLLGIGLGSIANLINPDRIILGGGVVEALGERFLDATRAQFNRHAFRSASDAAKLVLSELGDNAGAIGAALLARDRCAASTSNP